MALDIGTIFAFWEDKGVFDYLLPFLLIFAVVYGILGATRILSGNKGVNATIGITVGLLALRLTYVRDFFTESFPRLGVGVAIILMLLILTGLFIRQENLKVMYWIFIGIGAIIGIVVVFGSFSSLGWAGGTNWFQSEAISWLISISLLIGLIVVVVLGQMPPGESWKIEGKTAHRAPE